MKRNWWQSVLLREWHERLTAVLTGVFLLQFVIWIEKERHVWLPETVLSVKLTILVVVLTELFPWVHWALRRVIQAAGILVSLGLILGYSPVGRDLHPIAEFNLFVEDVGLLIGDNFMQLAPFVWFALAAWIVALTTFWWMKAKWRIMTALIVAVAVFAIRDSFSLVTLWLQVATMILCGLFLLIVRHFAGLKEKNPAGWAHLRDYPLNIALPTGFMVSLVVFLGTLAPDVRALVMDPYTLWKNVRGESIEVFNKGFGNSSILGGDSTSGYSRNDSTLGGEFSFDYSPVMTVSTTHRTYLRGETRSLYSGRGWLPDDNERRTPLMPVPEDGPLAADSRAAPTKIETVEVLQTVTMLEDAEPEYPVLFGGYEIDQLSGVSGAVRASVLWAPRLGELRWNSGNRQTYPSTYTIISQVPIIDEDALRTVTMDLPSRAGLEPYLFLPETLPSRVRERAQQVTQAGTNMYDKAKLLELYLSGSFPYTNTPDVSKGRSRDFVDRFLFEIQEGYCDYYSTAMAVMARSIGIPARWVKGYTSGTNVLIDEMMYPDELLDLDGAGDYTVRNSDAHSWVELYFPGYGWIPFEPTAGFALPTFANEEDAASGLLPGSTEPFVFDEGAGGRISQAIGWGAGAVAAALLIAFLWKNRDHWRAWLPVRSLGKPLDLNQRAVLEFNRLLRYARRKGYSRAEHETARESADRWIARDRWLQHDLDALLRLFEKAKYSGVPLTDKEYLDFSRTVRKLKEEM